MNCNVCGKKGGALRGTGKIVCRRCWTRANNKQTARTWGPNTVAVVKI